MQNTNLKRTPFYNYIKNLDAFFAPFGSWEMPIYISSIKDEHLNVRNNVGWFDISHMGSMRILGRDTIKFLEYMTTGLASKLNDGDALYTLVCNENAGIVDDIIIYRVSEEDFILVVNASNIDKVYDWFVAHRADYLVDIERDIFAAAVAVQGPASSSIIDKLTSPNFSKTFKYYSFTFVKIFGEKAMLVRGGYTGEVGYELFFLNAPDELVKNICAFFEGANVKCSGLGARDTLRIESGYSLYGHEINDETNPISSGLAWTVDLTKNNFIGKDKILEIKSRGNNRFLRGVVFRERTVPRALQEVYIDEKVVGVITSGTYSFTLDKPIALVYIDIDVKDEVYILRGEKRIYGDVVRTRFYYNPMIKD